MMNEREKSPATNRPRHSQRRSTASVADRENIYIFIYMHGRAFRGIMSKLWTVQRKNSYERRIVGRGGGVWWGRVALVKWESGRFGIGQIWNLVDLELGRFEIGKIWNRADLKSGKFGIRKICNRAGLKSGRFGIG